MRRYGSLININLSAISHMRILVTGQKHETKQRGLHWSNPILLAWNPGPGKAKSSKFVSTKILHQMSFKGLKT